MNFTKEDMLYETQNTMMGSTKDLTDSQVKHDKGKESEGEGSGNEEAMRVRDKSEKIRDDEH